MAPRSPEFRDCYTEEPNSGCWLWARSLSDCYGQWRGQRAHRVSYEMHKGPIPAGMYVCHHCDVPSCVNPDHLFVGTPSDNTRDMVRKGRHLLHRAVWERAHCESLAGDPEPKAEAA